MRTNWNTRSSAGDWNSSRIKSRKYLHPTGSFLVSEASHSSTDQDHCSFVYGIWQAQSLWLWDCISYFIKAFFEALGNNKSVLGNKFSSSTFAQHSIYIVNVEVNVCVCVGMGKCTCVYMCVCVLKYLTITELLRSAVYIGELQKISEGHVMWYL